jgi:hypothetical protein
MSLQWTISPQQRLVLAVAKGEVTPAEFGRYIAAIDEAGAVGYAKLFDVSGLTGSLGDALLQTVARAVEMKATQESLGPIAIVASNGSSAQAHFYAHAATVDRPLKIFSDLDEARRWLESMTNQAS